MSDQDKKLTPVQAALTSAKPPRKPRAKPTQRIEGDDNVQMGGRGVTQTIRGNGNVQLAGGVQVLSIRTTKAKVEIAPPPGSIGAVGLLKARIDGLFKEINAFRAERLGQGFKYGAIYGELARAFGLKAADWKQIWLWPESRAAEIVAWLEAKRDNTQEGRIRKAAQRPGYKHSRGHLFRLETEALSRLGLDGNSDEVRRQRQLLTGHESRSTMPDAAFANWVAYLEAEVRREHGESTD